MQRSTQLCIACLLMLVCQCAAQGGGRGDRPKAVYANPRSFSQWDHSLDKDPLVLVAFIAAIISGTSPTFLCVSSILQPNANCLRSLSAESLLDIPVSAAVPGFLLIMWQLVYDYVYSAAVSLKLCSKRPLTVRSQLSSSDYMISSKL